MGVTGAEQLLLDTHALKTFLLSLPTVESSINTKPPTMYTNVVVRTMTKVEMILKIVMSEINSHEEFVTTYVRLLPDSDSSELQKVLEMKALKRQEQTSIIQIYKSRVEGQATVENRLKMQSSTISALENISDSSMRRLEQLVKKKT